MSNLNAIPTQFQVISTQPELKIRYSTNRWNRIFGFQSFGIGIGTLIMMICFTIFQYNMTLENMRREDLPTFMIVMNIIFVPFSLWWIWTGACEMSGCKEVSATRNCLSIVYTCKLLGVCLQTSILASGISHLELSLLSAVGSDDDDSWRLNVVNDRSHNGNWKLFLTWLPIIKFEKTIDRQVRLCSYSISRPSEWLGRLLADFYRIELRS
jgi:hypothetical protein